MQATREQFKVNSDEEIINKILEGDISLFEILVRRYNQVIYRIARAYRFNHEDAEDLMQDTHVAAYTHLAGFEGRSSYKTWISRIMINKCLYKLKYGYFKNEMPAGEITEQKTEFMQAQSNDNQNGQAYLNRELSAILEKSIHHIPELYRSVFVLREIEGFSIAETAGLLGITETNVKVRLSRAKALLQKEMENFYSKSEIFSFNLVHCDSMVQKVFSQINRMNQDNSAS